MKLINSAIAVIVFALLSAPVFSQKSQSFIGISGGISFPAGNWGKADYIVNTDGYQNDPAGFAATGGMVQVDGAYFFSKYIGVGAMISYGTYKPKDIDTLSGGYQESFDVDQVTTTANSYKVWNYLAGLYFNFLVQKKLSVTARALAGLTHATTPQYSVDVEDGGIDDGTFYQKSASKSAFGFNLGAGLCYRIISPLSINLRADYFYSKPAFTIQNTEHLNAAGRLVTNYNQPLEGVNLTLCVAYVFNKHKVK